MTSLRYQSLQERLGIIGRSLFPDKVVEPQGPFDITTANIHGLSFRLLAHAEFESYFEDRCLEIAKAIDSSWKASGHVSRSTLTMLAFSGQKLEELPVCIAAPDSQKIAKWKARIRPDDRLQQSISNYFNKVRNENHGIREKDIILMLLPVGFDPDKLDPYLITELNNFASIRGQAAHTTIEGQIENIININDEQARVARIESGIEAVDAELNELLKNAAGQEV